MKKNISGALILLLVLSMVSGASAAATSASFTHPELGEFLTITFNNAAPYFTIYGFMYYEVLDPTVLFRGMQVNQVNLINKKMTGLDDSLNKILDSVEGLTGDPVPFAFKYAGNLEGYNRELEALPREERVKAIRRLGGFEGRKGYSKLPDMPGFEHVDVTAFEDEHMEFNVRVGNKSYSCRVLMLHFSQEDWVEYNERYFFLKVDGAWRLARVAREYTDDYSARGKYIHGLAGSQQEVLEEITYESLRGAAFGMTTADVETLENKQAQGNTLRVDDIAVYRLPATIEYQFSNDKLSGVTYTLRNIQSFFAAFISLYTRYSDPITVNENGDVTWSLNDMTISLNYIDESPTLVFAPY